MRKLKDIPPMPRTILVADDEHLVATGLCASLRQIGFTALEPANDGRAAIELCRSYRPDLALLDINMPNVNGIDAAKSIYKELEIPVIIFSAFSDAEFIVSTNRIGVFGYLLKPVSQDQLRAGITIGWGRYLDHMQLGAEVEDLASRLEARKIIEQAKWVLVKRRGIEEPEAMRLLQRQARNNRRPLLEVAQSLLDGEDLLRGG